MPEKYQGRYVFRCGGSVYTRCFAMDIENRRKTGLSGNVVVRDRCKTGSLPCHSTVVADKADMEILIRLGYILVDTLDNPVSD